MTTYTRHLVRFLRPRSGQSLDGFIKEVSEYLSRVVAKAESCNDSDFFPQLSILVSSHPPGPEGYAVLGVEPSDVNEVAYDDLPSIRQINKNSLLSHGGTSPFASGSHHNQPFQAFESTSRGQA